MAMPIEIFITCPASKKKEDLPLRFEDALNLADDDIDDNWETYADRFLRGDFS
jgi:hypothetical protein